MERGGRITGVVTDEGEIEGDAVVSTAALPALAPLLPECASAYREALESIEFLGVLCLLVRLKEHVTPSFWVNLNDPRAPFNGMIEYSNLNPWREQGGSEVLYIPLYMRTDDPRFLRRDSETAEELLGGLEAIFPACDRSQVVEVGVDARLLCPGAVPAAVQREGPQPRGSRAGAIPHGLHAALPGGPEP